MTRKNTHNRVTSVVVLDASEQEAMAVVRAFGTHGPAFSVSVKKNLRTLRAGVASQIPDIVIMSSSFPEKEIIDVINSGRTNYQFPVIILTDKPELKNAIAMIKAGAGDYVVKTGYILATLPVLATRVMSEWQRHRAEHEKQQLNARARMILEWIPEFVGIADKDGTLVYVNRAAREILGIKKNEDIAGDRIQDLFPKWTVGAFVHTGPVAGGINATTWRPHTKLRTKSGQIIEVSQAIFAHNPSSEIEYYGIVAQNNNRDRQQPQDDGNAT